MKAKIVKRPDGTPVPAKFSVAYTEGDDLGHWNAYLEAISQSGLFTKEEASIVMKKAVEGFIATAPSGSTDIKLAKLSNDRTKDFFVTFTANGGKEYTVDVTETVKELNEQKK